MDHENREAYEAEDGGCAYDFGPIDRSIDRSWTTLLSPFHSSLMVGSVEGAIKSQRDSLSLALRFLPLAPWAGMGPRLTPRDARQTHPPLLPLPVRVYTARRRVIILTSLKKLLSSSSALPGSEVMRNTSRKVTAASPSCFALFPRPSSLSL